ncbi:hypothetical protein Q1695_004949 [Nippostrongylus brasiliensis]|nr:hypothetical protein Q1695_004949 [Nippostrongylus brasiliensis]
MVPSAAVRGLLLLLLLSVERLDANDHCEPDISRTEVMIRTQLLSKLMRQVDQFCSEREKICYMVHDSVVEEDNRLVGYRGVRGTGANGSLELSYARILPPTPLTWKNFNTKNWRIDKRTVRKSYATVLIVGAFSTSALKLDTKREQKVLMIGLAGGVLANFLSTIPNVKISITIVDIEPVMKQIATKWFGIKESPTMRIVVQDGVEFVSEEAQKGAKYDAVIVDACVNDRRPMMSPIESFIDSNVIENLRKITKDDGVTTVTIVTMVNRTQEVTQKVSSRYSRSFGSCHTRSSGATENILFCFPKGQTHVNETEVEKRFDDTDAALGYLVDRTRKGAKARKAQLEKESKTNKNCPARKRSTQMIEEESKLIAARLLRMPRITVARLCGEPRNKTCFRVYDDIRPENGRVVAFRSLQGENDPLVSSFSRLVVPWPLTPDNSNSTKWAVDKRMLYKTYAGVMIVGAFASGALELNSKKTQNILIIGLGGAVINRFFTTIPNVTLSITVVDINPVMKEIATKWFGMKETPHHRIVIQDGIEFVKKAAIKGLKYDAILLDLCVHVQRPMMCPIDEFLKNDAVQALNAITADNGATIVNIIPSAEHAIAMGDRVMYYYTQHFRSCHLYDGATYEQMLFCSPLERYDWRENFNERLVASNAALGNVIALPAGGKPQK